MKKKRKLGRKLLSFLLALAMVVGLMPGMGMTAYAAGDGTENKPIEISSWDELKSAMSGSVQNDENENNPTYYIITDNITSPANGYDCILVVKDRHVVLNLNGKTIDRNLSSSDRMGEVIQVQGNLTITDNSDTKTGKITGGKKQFGGGGIYVTDSGTVTMNGGTISGNSAGTSGGGVFVANNGKFFMNGGTISGNSATKNGGGVYVYSFDTMQGTFTMLGGSITDNSATQNGGGVYVDGGKFNISGNPIIKDNTQGNASSIVTSNVYLPNGNKINVVNALTNDAKIGVTMETPGVFTSSTESAKASDYKANFTIDNSDFILQKDGNELKLEEPVSYPLWVGGVRVISANKDDVFADTENAGQVSFAPATDTTPATLTLNGFTFSGSSEGIKYEGSDQLNIVLTGENSITSTDSKDGIRSTGNLNFSGAGSLSVNASGFGAIYAMNITMDGGTVTVEGEGICSGIRSSANNGYIVVNGGTLNAKGICGIMADNGGSVTISGADVTATGSINGIDAGSVSITGSTVTATGTGDNSHGISGEMGVTISGGTITASGSGKAINGTVNNAIAGTGWTNKEGTQGKADITVSETGQDISSYKKVQFPAEPWLYNITIPTTENGTVTAMVGDTEVTAETKVEAGKTVTLTVKPDSGYRLKELSVSTVKEATTVADLAALMSERNFWNNIQKLQVIKVSGHDIICCSIADTSQIVQTLTGATTLTKDGNTYTARDSDDKPWIFYMENGKLSGKIQYYGDEYTGQPTTNSLNSEVTVDNTGTTPTFTMPKGDVTVTATFEPSATAPTIKTQPKNLELTYGYIEGSVSVEATPSENHTLSYQWYSNTTNAVEGGKVIEGATKASYTIPTGKNAGTEEYYYCVVTAAFMGATATTTSDVVKVTVKKAASSVKTAPKARDITYTGKPQALVEGGTAEGGEMQYSLDGEKYYALVPNGTDAGTYYIWYKVVGDENHLDSDAACVTSKIRADISKTVTFKVVNGSWNDGEAKDKVVKLEGFEGDTLKLSADKIPAVGTKPSDGYKEGSWDVVPKADTEIKADTTFTYTYVKKEEVTPEPTEEPTPSEKAKLTVTAKDQTIDFGGAISKADSKYVIKGLQTGDEAVVTLKADMKKFIITPVVTVKNGDKDVTENYDIEAVEGKLAIKQVPMVMAIAKGNSIKATTYKIANVDGYLIYTGYCGGTAKLVKTIKGNKAVSYTYKKIAGKALNRKKASKVIVKAYRLVDGKKVVVATSMTAHVAGIKDKKLTNASKITVKAEKLDLKKGNVVSIGAKVSLAAKKKAQLSKGHAAGLRYASSNKVVATIDANGKIKAVGKGTCTVYAVAVDGARKTVKVTVK